QNQLRKSALVFVHDYPRNQLLIGYLHLAQTCSFSWALTDSRCVFSSTSFHTASCASPRPIKIKPIEPVLKLSSRVRQISKPIPSPRFVIPLRRLWLPRTPSCSSPRKSSTGTSRPASSRRAIFSLCSRSRRVLAR